MSGSSHVRARNGRGMEEDIDAGWDQGVNVLHVVVAATPYFGQKSRFFGQRAVQRSMLGYSSNASASLIRS